MCSKYINLKIGSLVRVGGKYGPIETITDYDSETDTYTVVSHNGMSTGYISPGDVVMIPVKSFEQLRLFEL